MIARWNGEGTRESTKTSEDKEAIFIGGDEGNDKGKYAKTCKSDFENDCSGEEIRKSASEEEECL